MIASDSWRIIETILKRYPKKKKEYNDYLDEVMTRRPGKGKTPLSEEYSKPQSTTEAAALRMTSARADRIKKEIEAVEYAYNLLKPEEKKVIRMRYWSGGKKPVPYLAMSECNFSERQMKRIVRRTIERIGRYIGEI